MKTTCCFLGILILLSACSLPLWGQPLIVDHTCTCVEEIPPQYLVISKASLRLTYGHTSHGSQIISGMNILMNHDTLYDWFNDHNYYLYGGGNPIAPAGDLSLWDYVPDGDLGNPDRLTWAILTRIMLTNSNGAYVIYPHLRNVVMWSWCGQVSWASESDINTYLNLMSQLEADFPDVTFVYMTGHLDGTGVAGNLNQRNEQIRSYCRNNNKVLFDFADIESYDPDGNCYLQLGANDNCDYSGGNWAVQWCNAHPADPLCESCECAHSQSLNCNRKARAFWWMIARLAGWTGNGTPQVTISASGTNILLRWTPLPGATGYRVYSSLQPDIGFTEDTTGTFSPSTWSALMPDEKRFYHVIALYE
jgi:hypothetical protein